MVSSTHITLLDQLRDASAPLAWDEFFDRYWRLIHAAARQRGCAEASAEEVVQDVMLAVFEKRDVFRYDPARGRFRDWLCTVVRNKVAQKRRRPSERVRGRGGNGSDLVETEPIDGETLPDEQWEQAFERSLLAAMLDVVRREVNPRIYQAFELVAIHGMSGTEVARITGQTRNAVYLARSKVLKRLRELGAPYAKNGQLVRGVQEAIRQQPPPVVERAVTSRVAATQLSRWGVGQ